ncbi:Maf family protein [Nigerium massiliense]|uniref:Maf family protein n=1 Tax=Nigerium massiliense TaxID=1522317 RepID=UPI00058D9800|nr:nucleoside triphosphate pyrophosphatase [Nigerium massiliense]
MRLILASASPARLQTLRAAGVDPVVHVSGVDESGVRAPSVAETTATLATLKAQAVLAEVGPLAHDLIVGCDSLLELDGRAVGKPGSPEAAAEVWRRLRGRTGVLHTGHHLAGPAGHLTRVGSTVVHFADVSDAEIDAYVATGEPVWVAGAFAIDGYGAAFVRGIEGDPHNVVGISVPLLREMLAELGVAWHDLWRPAG